MYFALALLLRHVLNWIGRRWVVARRAPPATAPRPAMEGAA